VIPRFTVVLPLVAMLAGCGAEESAPLTVSEMTIFAPLPGQPAGVAYFSLQNSSPAAVTLQDISSPDFVAVEIHTTLQEGGIAQMLPVDALTIAEHSEIAFTPGGPHLMLMGPLEDLGTGDTVTLEFIYTSEWDGEDVVGQISLRAPVQAR